MSSDLESNPENLYLRAARTPGGNAAFHNFHNDFEHILNPNERRRLALAEIDKVPFGWYHVRAVAVAGAGFFADSYDFFAINLALQMLGISFWHDNGGIIPEHLETAIKVAASVGAVIGQIVFGWLADVLGRKRMYGVELIIMSIGTLAQSLSSPSSAVTISGLLIFGRILMGLGIGGDYPMSAIITAEFASTRWRGRMMAAVFSMQGFGQLAATLVAFLTTLGYRDSLSTAQNVAECTGRCQLAADQSWRLIIGFGALPAVFALYYRLTIPETPRFTFDVALDTEKACVDIRVYLQAEEAVAEILGDSYNRRGNLSQLQNQLVTPADALELPPASWSDFYSYFTRYRNGSVLFATMASWFLIDFAYYGLALNNSTILDAIGFPVETEPNVYRDLFTTALGNFVLVCAGAIPGYILSILTIDTLGRRPIQIGGFAILTIIFLIIGCAYKILPRGALLALYILAQLFFNFGPNLTTFVVPGECFPTRYRSTCHGLSAACGKIGATAVQVMSDPLLKRGVAAGCTGARCSPWLAHLMQIMAATSFCGMIVSFMIPETKQQTLEVLAGEEPMGGTPRSNSSRKNDFMARLTSSLHLHLRHGRGETRRRKGGAGHNGAPIEMENSVSSASVSSRNRILRRPRSNEEEINDRHGHKQEAYVL